MHKYQDIKKVFATGYAPIYVIEVLHGQEIVGTFSKKELQNTKFRIIIILEQF